MKKSFYSVLFVLIIFNGCAQIAVQNRLQEYKDRIDPLLGSNKEKIILTFGMPTERNTIEGMEVWIYFKSYGQRGNVYAPSYGYNISGSSWESYDKLTFYFKNDKFIKWDSYVQR